MRNFILFILLVASVKVQGQDFMKLKRKGDSLLWKKNYKAAATIYDECIDSVLTSKQQISDFDWWDLLVKAIKVNSSLNKSNPIKYSRLAYSTRAEKMSDKIELLKDMGIDHIFSFSIGDWQSEYFVDNSPYMCPDVYGKTMLVWETNDNVFFQAFSPCITYKSLKMKDTALVSILKNHANDLIKQKIERMPTKHSEIQPHSFTFYSNGAALKTITEDVVDFNDIDEKEYGRYWQKQHIDAAHQIYQANKKTYFSTIFSRAFLDADEYFAFINSGHERAKLGGVKKDNSRAF